MRPKENKFLRNLLNSVDLKLYYEIYREYFIKTQFREILFRTIIFTIIMFGYGIITLGVIPNIVLYFAGEIIMLIYFLYRIITIDVPKWMLEKWIIFFVKKSIIVESHDYSNMKTGLEVYIAENEYYYNKDRSVWA